MSCNGCRILRKGCNDNCILRQSLQSIETPQAQSNATVFVAKFFGRAGLMSFLSSVPQSQRPALFQSLLFESCGRTVNPVTGAAGLLGTGKWHLCQSAVETVLRGGVPCALPEFTLLLDHEGSSEGGGGGHDNNNDRVDLLYGSKEYLNCSSTTRRVTNNNNNNKRKYYSNDIDLGNLAGGFSPRMKVNPRNEKRRQASPTSDESETTTLESCFHVCDEDDQHHRQHDDQTKLLRLFI